MQHSNRISVFLLCLLSTLPLCGCGGQKYGMVPAVGHITYKGQPLKFGSVAFHPIKTVQQGVPHRMGLGFIKTDGSYSLSTFKKDDGVMPGEYAVIVICREKPKASDPEDYSPPSIIPERYARSETTPLKITVPDGKAGPLTFDFKVEEK